LSKGRWTSAPASALVGDGAVGILALKMAEDLMLSDTLDYCVVVAAEEADWLLCDAYRKWRLLRSAPPIEPFRQPPRGTILSEGAGAILLAPTGPTRIERIAGGTNFSNQREAHAAVRKVFAELCETPPYLIAANANGTFIDQAEHTAIGRDSPTATVYVRHESASSRTSAGIAEIQDRILSAFESCISQSDPF